MSQTLTGRIEKLEIRLARVEGVADRPMWPSTRRIIDQVAAHYSVSKVQLLGSARAAHIALARHMAMHLCRELHGHSLPRIGSAFNRDHTSVLHAVRRIAALLEADPALRATWDALAEAIMSHHPGKEA